MYREPVKQIPVQFNGRFAAYIYVAEGSSSESIANAALNNITVATLLAREHEDKFDVLVVDDKLVNVMYSDTDVWEMYP